MIERKIVPVHKIDLDDLMDQSPRAHPFDGLH